MIAPSLLETAAALALHAGVLATLVSGLGANVRLAHELWTIEAELFRERQVEHLLDRAVMQAGAGPSTPPPVARADGGEIVLHSDRDGDGHVNPRSAEVTSVYFKTSGAKARLVYKLGRQAMTVMEDLSSESRFVHMDAAGMPATLAAEVKLIELRIERPETSRPHSYLHAPRSAVP